MLEKFEKKRNRYPLASTALEIRYRHESQTKKVYLEGSRAKTLLSPSQERTKLIKAQTLSQNYWCTYSTPSTKIILHFNSPIVKTPEYFRSRRVSIYHYFLACSRVQSRQRKYSLVGRPVHANALSSFNLSTGLEEDRIEIARAAEQAQQNQQDIALQTENDLNNEEDDNDEEEEDFQLYSLFQLSQLDRQGLSCLHFTNQVIQPT